MFTGSNPSTAEHRRTIPKSPTHSLPCAMHECPLPVDRIEAQMKPKRDSGRSCGGPVKASPVRGANRGELGEIFRQVCLGNRGKPAKILKASERLTLDEPCRTPETSVPGYVPPRSGHNLLQSPQTPEVQLFRIPPFRFA